MQTRIRARRWLARALIPILLLQSAAAQLPDLGDPAQASLSPAQEKRIAEEALREVRFHEPAYVDDPEVEEYLSAIGERLTSGKVTQRTGYQFFVLRDSTINAFAMPGGVIGVHSGLFFTTRTESELAGVLAHEIGHVEQHHIARMLSRQGNTMAMVLGSMLVAILAGRASANAAGAVLAGGQAAAIQSQLSYSRDYEREADRIGLQILASAGFDPQGMPDFFERMYQYTRSVENNAPAYLRTHPLTQDRIADIAARVRQLGERPKVENSIDYELLRAKIAVEQDGPTAALARFEPSRPATPGETAARWYGIARAKLQQRDFKATHSALAALQAMRLPTSMVDTLAADLARAEGQGAQAAAICRASAALYPGRASLIYCQAEGWIAADKPDEALRVLDGPLRYNRQDYRLYVLQSRAATAQGRSALAHRAQAEVYLLQGDLGAAADQLQLAQRDRDGDFIEQASIDARLREVRDALRESKDEPGKRDKP